MRVFHRTVFAYPLLTMHIAYWCYKNAARFVSCRVPDVAIYPLHRCRFFVSGKFSLPARIISIKHQITQLDVVRLKIQHNTSFLLTVNQLCPNVFQFGFITKKSSASVQLVIITTADQRGYSRGLICWCQNWIDAAVLIAYTGTAVFSTKMKGPRQARPYVHYKLADSPREYWKSRAIRVTTGQWLVSQYVWHCHVYANHHYVGNKKPASETSWG